MLKWLKDKICPSDKHEILSLEITIENLRIKLKNCKKRNLVLKKKLWNKK